MLKEKIKLFFIDIIYHDLFFLPVPLETYGQETQLHV